MGATLDYMLFLKDQKGFLPLGGKFAATENEGSALKIHFEHSRCPADLAVSLPNLPFFASLAAGINLRRVRHHITELCLTSRESLSEHPIH